MTVKTSSGDVAIAHNGDIVNADKLRSKLQTEGWAFLTTTDSEDHNPALGQRTETER